jgi:hypothetical protein
MDRAQAIADVESVFASYMAVAPTDQQLLAALNDGKLYELYVLSELLENLRNRGFTISFVGSSLAFKAAPGKIKLSDPHFVIVSPMQDKFWVFVDIEFITLGTLHGPVTDLSSHHEIDIVVVDAIVPNPLFDQIALGVECKCHAKFGKNLIKEALGIRRELSLLHPPLWSRLTQSGSVPPVYVPADPCSEFWLAFIDPGGQHYGESPAAFGIELRHIEP